MHEIYLDTSASTPLHPEVKDKLLSTLSFYGNPSSLHTKGRQSAELISDSSDIIAKCLNIDTSEIYYTSGATMSNNLAIQGFLEKHLLSKVRFVTSCMEHDDIYLMTKNYPYDLKSYIPCEQKTGLLDLDCLYETLKELDSQSEDAILVSIQWANNEMGVIQDMRTISEIVNTFSNCYLHTDATQYIPWYRADIHSLKIDMLSCSAQKLGGLKGTGLLYIRNGVSISPIIYGDQGLIGGTENVPGIVCMGEAFKQLDFSKNALIAAKRDYLYDLIKDYGQLVGSMQNRLPHNICMIFDGVRGEELQAMLDGFGIYVSTGSACSSHTNKTSRTLKAMGYTEEQSNSSIRITLSNDVTYSDLDYVAEMIKHSIQILRNK